MNDVVTLSLGSGYNSGVTVARVDDAYTGGKVEEGPTALCLNVGALAGCED